MRFSEAGAGRRKYGAAIAALLVAATAVVGRRLRARQARRTRSRGNGVATGRGREVL